MDRTGKGGAILPDAMKDVVQVLQVNNAGGNPAVKVPVTLGLGMPSPDATRSVMVKKLDESKLANVFLKRRKAPAGFDPLAGYYDKVDASKLKRTFTDWQTQNGWVNTGIGKGDDAYVMYFNANDLEPAVARA